jgi:IS30 family transposase
MGYHGNAALTRTQRQLVHELHDQGVSQTELARRFGVTRRTIVRWAKRSEMSDRSTAPKQHGRVVVDDEYRTAVLQARTTHPILDTIQVPAIFQFLSKGHLPVRDCLRRCRPSFGDH